MVALVSPAYAGSYGNEEERVFLDGLQKIENRTDRAQAKPVKQSTYNTPRAPFKGLSIDIGEKLLKPRLEANIRYSNDRTIVMSEYWVPIAQNPQDGSVLFGDIRIMGDNNSNQEFNIGAGYRKLVTNKLLNDGILGGMLWYDRRLTKRGSKFNQLTAGLEWLSEQYDVRLNGYMPFNDSKSHSQNNPNGSGRGFVGNQIFVNTDQSVVEEALPGLDLELGYKLNFLDDVTDSTRFYVGGYHFKGDRVEDVTGWRARLASDITRDVQIGARFQKDDVRGSQAYLEATVRFPFGQKKSFQQDGLRSRLDESPERDIDIVSNEAVTDDGVNEVLFNATTGTIQNVIHVDNTNGAGTGTAEDPFNTLVAAQAAAGVNDLIYVHRGDGTTTGQSNGIVIDDDGQMLVGSAANLTFNGSRFSTSNGNDITGSAAILAPANPLGGPTITNGAGDGVSIMADNIFASGVIVDGASDDGIRITNANNLEIRSVNSNNNRNGILATYSGIGNHFLRIYNSTSDNNSNYGTFISVNDNVNFETQIYKNSFSSNFNDGLSINSNDNSISDINIIDNTANNNSGDSQSVGIQVNTRVNAQQTSLIKDNTVNNNGDIGIYVLGNTGNSVNNTVIQRNIINNNVDFGIVAQGFTGNGTLSGLIKNNTLSDNGGGMLLRALENTSTTISLQNNSVNNSSVNAFRIEKADNGIMSVDIERNRLSNSGLNGILIIDNSTNQSTIDLGGGSLGSAGNNTIFASALADISVDLDGDELKAENNFWGTSSGLQPANVILIDGSSIDASPFLTSDPN